MAVAHPLYFRPVPPACLGEAIHEAVETLAQNGQQVEPSALLYAEKRGGFSCRTCKYATAQNQTHGKCLIMYGRIHLDEGCCAAWDADLGQLQLHREF